MRIPTPSTIYVVVFTTSAIAAGVYCEFLAVHNDFWDSWFAGTNMVWSQPTTWFQPFFPFGYSLLLSVASLTGLQPATLGFYISMLAGATTAAAAATITGRFLGKWWGLACAIILTLYPRFFHYVTTAGADPLAGLLMWLAMLVLISSPSESAPEKRIRAFVFSGLFAGTAALVRHHALAAVLAFYLAYAIAYRGVNVQLLMAGACAGAVYSTQVIVCLTSGHHLVELSGLFNIYKMANSVNWFHTANLSIPVSAWQVFLDNPAGFVRGYTANFFSIGVLALPSLLLLILTRDRQLWRVSFMSGICIVLFSLVVSLGDSGRGQLVVLPLAAFQGVALLREVTSRWAKIVEVEAWSRNLRGLPPVLFSLCCVLFAAKDGAKIVSRHCLNREYRAIERILALDGVKHTSQVFSTDYDLYFNCMPGIVPRVFGGFAVVGARGVHVPPSSIDGFLDYWRHEGITHVILTKESELLLPEMALIHRLGRSTNDLYFRAQVDETTIFRVQ